LHKTPVVLLEQSLNKVQPLVLVDLHLEGPLLAVAEGQVALPVLFLVGVDVLPMNRLSKQCWKIVCA